MENEPYDLMNESELLLVYDHQCPVCHAYCQRVRVRPSQGYLHIIDARRESEVRNEITRRGLESTRAWYCAPAPAFSAAPKASIG